MDLPAVVAAYLIGSISFPWLVARWRDIDLRQVGSRKLGGSNLARALGLRWGALGGSLDAFKGALVVLAARAMGLPVETQIFCGVAAVAGQMWPVFHGLDGGRANATGWGVLVALDLAAAAVAAIPLVAAVVARYAVRPHPSRVVPVASILTFPVWCAAILETSGLEPEVVGGLIVAALVLLRRITADLDLDLATGAPLARILLWRALYDRSELQRRGSLPL